MGYTYEYDQPNGRPPMELHPEVAAQIHSTEPAQKFMSHRPAPRREAVSFSYNVPERIALRFADGKVITGPRGPRMMYSLCDDRVMFLDIDVADQIARMAPAPGEEFWLVKRKPAHGGAIYWHVYREDPTPRPQETPLERDLRLSINQIERRKETAEAAPPRPSDQPAQEHAAPLPPVQSSAAAAHTEWVNSLVANVNALTDAFAAALQHAAQYGQSVKSEDVRTLLVTSYINTQRGRER
jgi:hypothetical protein